MKALIQWFTRTVPGQFWLRPAHYLGSNDTVSIEWLDAYKRGLHGNR